MGLPVVALVVLACLALSLACPVIPHAVAALASPLSALGLP
jgi:hypothetical protein